MKTIIASLHVFLIKKKKNPLPLINSNSQEATRGIDDFPT
jgi:hypothetical protein